MHTLMRLSSPPRLYLIKASIGLGIALTTLALPSTPACAGSWSGPDYTYSGTSTNSDGTSSPWTWGPNAYFYDSSAPGVSYWGGQTASGDVQATFTWNPNPADPNDAPPTVWVRESADSYEGSNSDLSPSSADDGLGDTAVVDDESNAWSHGTHYVKYSGQSAITLTHTLSAGGQGEVINMSYQAALAGNTLISSGIETSYQKSYDENSIGYLSLPHQRKPDGSIQVESCVYPYNNTDPTVSQASGWRADMGFTASSPFGGNSQYAWSAGGDGTISGPTDTSSIAFSLTKPDTDGFPGTTHLQVTVTDPDSGKTDNNTYDVTWHLPYEENESLGVKLTKHPIASRLEDIDPDTSHGTEIVPAGKIDFGGAIDAVAVALPMVGAAEKVVGLTELVGKIAGITKWEYTYQEAVELIVGNDAQAWDDAEQDQKVPYVGEEPNIPSTLKGDNKNYFLCKMSYKLVEYDRDESWHADGYTVHGYDGNSKHLVASRKIDNVVSERYFTQFRTGSGGTP